MGEAATADTRSTGRPGTPRSFFERALRSLYFRVGSKLLYATLFLVLAAGYRAFGLLRGAVQRRGSP